MKKFPLLEFSRSDSHVVDFTYSHEGQSNFDRKLTRVVEKFSGQRAMHRLYLDWAHSGKRNHENVFDAAIRLLKLSPQISGQDHLQSLPVTGGLLLVANHPFGIVDGLTLGHLGMALRGNVAIMTNSLLCRVPEVDPHLLPVDFSSTLTARRLTSETRRRTTSLLSEGKVVALFPAGSVATANSPLGKRAVDLAWHPFVGRLATLPGVTTLPIYFKGQNSRLFQVASHYSYPLRVALIFYETRRRMRRAVDLTIGAPISADDLRKLDRGAVADFLRRRTIALAGPDAPNLDEVYVWPSRVTW